MLFKICIIVKLLVVQITVCQVLHQDLSYIPSSSDTLKRCTRQTNNGIPIGSSPFQNIQSSNAVPILENNMVQNINSLPMNMATQNSNNLAFERLVQDGNNINNNGFLLNNNLPDSNNLLFGNSIPAGNNQLVGNVLLNGHNEQVANGFQNLNNIQTENGFKNNNWNSISSNIMQNTHDLQLTNSVPLNLPGSFQFGNNMPLNNIVPNNNNMMMNRMTNLIQNNLPNANVLQNSFNLPANDILSNKNNMLFSNRMNEFPHTNGFGNGFPNKSPTSKYFPTRNGIPGIHDIQMNNGMGNLNNGFPIIAGNNDPFFNSVPFNGLQDPNVNDSFTITTNIPLHTVVPRSVMNNNDRIFNSGIIANDFSAGGRIPPNGFPFNSWPRSNNMMLNNGPIGNNCQV